MITNQSGLPAAWSPVTQSPAVTQLSVPPGAAALWAVNTGLSSDNAYYLAGATNSWTLVPGVHLTSIAATPDGLVWGADGTQTKSDNIFMYSGDKWVQPLSGILTGIALTLDGALWGVNASQPPTDPSNIYQWDPTTNTWLGIPGYLTSIAAGSGDAIWGLGPQAESNIFRYTGALGQPWENYTTGQQTTLAAIAVGADNSVWGVDGENNLWTLVEGSGFEQISGAGSWLSASDVNSVWLVGTDGSTSVWSDTVTQNLGYIPCVYRGKEYAPGETECINDTPGNFYWATCTTNYGTWNVSRKRCSYDSAQHEE